MADNTRDALSWIWNLNHVVKKKKEEDKINNYSTLSPVMVYRMISFIDSFILGLQGERVGLASKTVGLGNF